MAVSGSVSTSGYQGRYLVCTWSASQSIAENKSVISWTLKGAGGSGWYYSGPIWIGFENVGGGNIWSNTYWTSRQKLYDGTVVASGKVTIPHNTDGTRSFNLFLEGAIFSAAYNVDGHATITLDQIPRYANPVPSLTARTETSLSISWTADGNVDQLSYSIDDGANYVSLPAPNASSGSFTVSGLSVGTTYPVKLKARRTDSQLVDESDAVDMATYSYPYALTMPDFDIGSNVIIGLFNPLGHSVTVELLASNNNVAFTGTTSGQSIQATPTANVLYASTPNAPSANYKVRVTYSGNADTKTGGLYTVVNSDPVVNSFTYADSNNTAVAITGNNQKIVQNISTPLFSCSLGAVNSASLASVEIVVNGETYTKAATATTQVQGGIINSASNVVAVLTVTDSRGFTKTAEVEIEMVAWNQPSAIITVERQSNFYSETDMKVDASFTQIGSSTITISVLGKAVPITGQVTPSDVTATLTDNVQSTVLFDNNFAWNIAITLTDSFGGSTTYNTYISRGIPETFFDRFRRSMSLNGFPTHDNSMEIFGGDYYKDGVSIVDIIYPVGSIYMSVNATNPSSFLGGTWTQIKDTFLLACGDTYANGATGGEAEHTLTVDEMPSHDHFQQYQSDTSYVGVHVKNYNSGGSIQGVQPANGTRRNNIMAPEVRVSTVATGGGQAHNNLPPYLAVYMWQRTA